jgi:hypothetical protein
MTLRRRFAVTSSMSLFGCSGFLLQQNLKDQVGYKPQLLQVELKQQKRPEV